MVCRAISSDFPELLTGAKPVRDLKTAHNTFRVLLQPFSKQPYRACAIFSFISADRFYGKVKTPRNLSVNTIRQTCKAYYRPEKGDLPLHLPFSITQGIPLLISCFLAPSTLPTLQTFEPPFPIRERTHIPLVFN